MSLLSSIQESRIFCARNAQENPASAKFYSIKEATYEEVLNEARTEIGGVVEILKDARDGMYEDEAIDALNLALRIIKERLIDGGMQDAE